MFIENRLEKLFKRIRADFTIPLRVVLWNGHEFNLSSEPTVTIHVPKPSALRYFIPPDLNKLGEAFVEGHIRVEGSVHELFRVAESLVSSVAANTRARFHRFRPSLRAHLPRMGQSPRIEPRARDRHRRRPAVSYLGN
ncbi:MAG: hypothetical protein Q8O70_06795, partial [Burkholderiales bacterium]|nr:hypothetical protein [Burkholderiales bacterium]